MIAVVSHLILGINFLSSFGHMVEAKYSVLSDSTTCVQAHGIYVCTPSLRISSMTLQSPLSSI